MKKMILDRTITAFAFMLVVITCCVLAFAGSDGEEDMPPIPSTEGAGEGVYATIEYRDDLIAADTLFMEVKAHPKAKFPKITGGYAETNVHCLIRIRGISVPRALQLPEERARPHVFVNNERKRFDGAMDYIWSLAKLNKIFMLHNPVVVKTDKVVECDVSIYIGGAWGSLGGSMINDEHARPLLNNVEWDWGTRNVTQLNPDIPK